jgi:elongation factor G
MTMPALISVVVRALTPADQPMLETALRTLTAEDPSISVTVDTANRAVVVAGTTETHLEIILDRLKRELGVAANVSPPQIAYKETITRPASHAAKYFEQTDAGSRYAHVSLSVYPSSGRIFENATLAGALPRRFITAIKQGIHEALRYGVFTGYPVDDIRIVLDDGSYHEPDSSEAAFRICGAMALRNAVKMAGPMILQPMMRVEVSVPVEDADDVRRNLLNRRGAVVSSETREGRTIVCGRVPLAGMSGYGTDLRWRTRGRGAFEMVFDRYDPIDMPDSDAGFAGPGVRVPLAPVPAPRLTGIALPEPPSIHLDD